MCQEEKKRKAFQEKSRGLKNIDAQESEQYYGILSTGKNLSGKNDVWRQTHRQVSTSFPSAELEGVAHAMDLQVPARQPPFHGGISLVTW